MGHQAGQHRAAQTSLQLKYLFEVPEVIVLDTDCAKVEYTQHVSDTCCQNIQCFVFFSAF